VNYEIRGLSLYFEKCGSGEPAIVFLHYWGGTSRTWSKVVAQLRSKFSTVAYDARGWGRSDKRAAGYKLSDLADEALSLIERLGIKTYVLVGHSLGGESRNSLHRGIRADSRDWSLSPRRLRPLYALRMRRARSRFTLMTTARTFFRRSAS
jgi:hypothetical protein